ncbi:MAG: M14 family zinc carboxypeptidase [Armatimonadota bacterium]
MALVPLLLMSGLFDDPLKTRAERTKYLETSTYEDVVSYCKALTTKYPKVSQLGYSGTSAKGRQIPLVTIAEPMVSTAQEAAKSGKLVIYVQANIHAGEVEGKEAAQHLMREWVRDRGLLKKAILLVQPIYNCDGNEEFAPQAKNRPGQNGPEMVGLRPNGQGLDLNRDCTKAESPEMQGALRNIYSWNPDVVFDLHTTDGTRHGYPMTYGGPGNPNAHPELLNYAFKEFFPAVRLEARKKFKLELQDYGNGFFQDGKWRFETFAADARFVTNYAGLRGALPILSEAMVYEPFDVRVRDTERFVKLCLGKMLKDAAKIKAIHAASETSIVGSKLATRFQMTSRGEEEVLLEKGLSAGVRNKGPVRDIEKVMMPVFDRFIGTTFAEVPFAYVIPDSEPKLIELLKLHGLKLEVIEGLDQDPPKTNPLEAFRISKRTEARSAFQGHKLITLEGEWRPWNRPIQGILVRCEQPLGRVAFELLEPSSMDGATAWGTIQDGFIEDTWHPVSRVIRPVKLKTRPL